MRSKLPPLQPGEDPLAVFRFPAGMIKIVGDIMAPMYTDEEYEEFDKHTEALLLDRS